MVTYRTYNINPSPPKELVSWIWSRSCSISSTRSEVILRGVFGVACLGIAIF